MAPRESLPLPLLNHLAARGWVCVAIHHRLSPRTTFPEHLVDVQRAIRWICEHIASYGGDPTFLAVTGGSAGGHLTALTALTANDPEYQPGFEGVDNRVQGARHLAALLRGASKSPVCYEELPNAQHGLELFHSLRTRNTVRGVDRFPTFAYATWCASRDQASAARSIR